MNRNREDDNGPKQHGNENADPDKVEQGRHPEQPTEDSPGGIRSRLVVVNSMSPGRTVRPATRVTGTSVVVVRKVGGMGRRRGFAPLQGGPYAT